MNRRSWRIRSIALAADISWGMADTIARQWGITPVDLEEPDGLVQDLPPDVQATRNRERLQKLMLAGQAFKASAAFQAMTDAAPGMACYVSGITVQGHRLVASNDAFNALFKDATDMFSDSMSHRTNESFLFAGLVAPEDRMNWARFAIMAGTTPRPQAAEAPRPPGTLIVKAVDREGQIRLFLARTHRVFNAVPTLGYVALIAIILEPCPASRYLTPQPGYRQTMKTFQSPRSGGRPVPAMGGGGGAGSSHNNNNNSPSTSSGSEYRPPGLAVMSLPSYVDETAVLQAASSSASTALSSSSAALFGIAETTEGVNQLALVDGIKEGHKPPPILNETILSQVFSEENVEEK